MMKNMKMKTVLTSVITILTITGIALFYLATQMNMNSLIKENAEQSMKTELNAQTVLIGEYVNHQEDLLEEFSKSPEIIDYLRDVSDTKNRRKHRSIQRIIMPGLITGRDFMQENGIRIL